MTDTPKTYTQADLDAAVGAALEEAAKVVEPCIRPTRQNRPPRDDPASSIWQQSRLAQEDADDIRALRPDALATLEKAKAEAVAQERERCAKKVEGFRANLNFEALLAALRNDPPPKEMIDAISSLLDDIATAIRAEAEKGGKQ